MNAQDLKNSILQLAIKGKLVEQREEEGTAKELLKKIEAEKKELIKEGKLKKQKELSDIKEDEIPFDIPKSWEWVRLFEIGEIVGGGTPKTGNSEFWNGGNIPWLTPADMKFVTGKYVEKGERSITEKGLKGSSARLMPKGTILYSSRAPIGYVAIANNDIATNQGFKSLVPYELRINEYMYYCLIGRTNEIISRASGTTFKEISGREFGLTVVPLPPLEEQKRIVGKIEGLMSYVDKYDAAYSEVKKLNKKFPEDMQKSILQYAIQGKLVEQREEEGTAEELYKQIQQEKAKLIKEGKIKKEKSLPEITEDEIPFDIPKSWKWVNMGTITSKLTDGSHNPPPNIGKEYYVISAKNIKNEMIIFGNAERYTDEKGFLKENKRTNISRGDIILGIIGGSIGNIAIYEHDKKVIAQRSISIINTFVSNQYIKMVIQSPLIQFQLKSSSGTAQGGVYLGALYRILIPLPPLAEQKRIVDKIDELMPYTKQLIK